MNSTSSFFTFSTRPVEKYTNIFLCGPEGSGKSSLAEKWVEYSLNKRSNHGMAEKGEDTPHLIDKKRNKTRSHQRLPSLHSSDFEDEDQNDDQPKENEPEESSITIGPQPAEEKVLPSSSLSSLSSSSSLVPPIRAAPIEVPKIHSEHVGASNNECILFDVTGAQSYYSKWKEQLYSSTGCDKKSKIDCILYVIDAPECLADEKKLKEAARGFWEVADALRSSNVAFALLVNKMDIFASDDDEHSPSSSEQEIKVQETILRRDGPIGKAFNLDEIYNRIHNFDIFATSSVTGESIFNVLHFISQEVVYPKRMREHQMRHLKTIKKKNGLL